MELEHLYYIEAECARPMPIGRVPEGTANLIPITGGRFEGEKMRGTILPIGADWAMRCSGGVIRGRVNTRYILRTDDGAVISLFTEGLMRGSLVRMLRGMAGKKKDASLYYFRQHLYFTAGDERYMWLNTAVCFGVLGIGAEGRICYDAYTLA